MLLGKHGRSLGNYGSQCRRVEAQSLEDGWRYLDSAYSFANRFGFVGRVGQQQNDVRVVMSEAAVLGQFRGAAGVRNAHVRGHDDIRRARVFGWIVVVEGERRAVVDLAELDSGGGGIRFQDTDCG